MVHYITIGDGDKRRERPVCFDQTLAYEFQKTTGKHYMLEVNLILKDLIAAGAATQTDDPTEAARYVDVVRMVDFFHSALRLGARKTGAQIDFTEYDVAEWVLSDTDASSQLTTWLIEDTFTAPGASANGDGKKKPVTAKKTKMPSGG